MCLFLEIVFSVSIALLDYFNELNSCLPRELISYQLMHALFFSFGWVIWYYPANSRFVFICSIVCIKIRWRYAVFSELSESYGLS